MLKFLKLFLLPLFAVITVAVACNKNEDITVEEAVDTALYSVQERGGIGKYGCFELVFPVSIQLPDSSVTEVTSYEEIKDALRTYFQNNGTGNGNGHGHGHHGAGIRVISFVYPISVVSQDGEVITVNNDTELRALRADCAGTFGNHHPNGHGQHGLSCFELVYPVTITFPDSTTAEAADRAAMRQLIHDWRQNNPGVAGRPKLTFPLTVKMTDDSTLVVLNNRDELRALKEDCE